MKKLLFVLPFLLLLSCSVQKRKYQSGYYVSWHAQKTKKETVAGKTSHSAASPAQSERPEIAVVEKEKNVETFASRNFAALSLQKSPKANVPPEDTCDVLVFKDGSEIKGKVKEVGTNEIKYKRCDTPDGPTYISKNSDIFMIKYANGTREVIKSEPQERVQSPEPVRTRNPNTGSDTDYRKARYRRQVHPLAAASLIFASLAIAILYAALIFSTGGLAFPATALVLPFIFSLIAIISGITAMRRIREQPDLFKGKGLALPGMIMGMVVASIYLLVLFIVLIALGI